MLGVGSSKLHDRNDKKCLICDQFCYVPETSTMFGDFGRSKMVS